MKKLALRATPAVMATGTAQQPRNSGLARMGFPLAS
jgi:hypothetical protein